MEVEGTNAASSAANTRYADLGTIFNAPNAVFANDTFRKRVSASATGTTDALAKARVLVVGAGGLGCELLKNLAHAGVQNVTLIDMDTIEVTNLNRQFLFRARDIGRFKSEVAAEFINRRFPGSRVRAFTKRIQEFEDSFYADFDVIIGGLDNEEARRWLNSIVHRLMKEAPLNNYGFRDANGLVQFDEATGNAIVPPGNKKPVYIDGGIDRLGGQARVMRPFETDCYVCTQAQQGGDQGAHTLKNQFCTIAKRPRIPEHVVVIVTESADPGFWRATFNERPIDTDSLEDMQWIYNRAVALAEEFKIKGVTYELAQSVVKNIMPNIASTNAIIAAGCVAEAVKIITGVAPVIANNWQYQGSTLNGVQSSTLNGAEVRAEREQYKYGACEVCSNAPRLFKVRRSDTIAAFKASLAVEGALRIPKKVEENTFAYADVAIKNPMLLTLFNDELPDNETFARLVEDGVFAEGEMLFLSDTEVINFHEYTTFDGEENKILKMFDRIAVVFKFVE